MMEITVSSLKNKKKPFLLGVGDVLLGDITYNNAHSVNETGFQIGYLKNGIFLWTFGEIDHPVLTDAHETISVTVVESISAKGQVIPPFIIMPGIQIPSRWVDNRLDENATIVTTPKGYIDDVTAQDFFDHFEKYTRSQSQRGKRLLLLDGCESHFTKDIFQKAEVTGVILYPFPPHLTHILQPLDVGIFSAYKHWHQEILQREIADGATDFNKADFMFHLQEVRRKKVAEDDLPGYISEGDSSTHSSDLSSESDEENVDQSPREVYQSHPEVEEIRMVSSTTLLINWNEVDTPELKMRQIRQYEQYVALRIECSVASGTPLTPSVSHVNEKLRKAHTTLAINSITAAQEMRRLKEKNLKRSARDQGTVILANYGPITVYDARLRVAKDLHNRRANQAAEELRFHKKE
ncbi:hypothetical protein FOXB_02376, partial [Fusarium oxysporum f. sp. conglutinans Fo5176]